MISPGHLIRLFNINRILVRHGLDEVIFIIPVFRPFRFLLRLLPWHWFPRARAPLGVRVRLALEDLGPIFVKFGQTLSTRRDLLPVDVAQELARLQDRVPPFPGTVARKIIDKAYGKPIDEVFACFEDEPLASASIAQVHSARLHDGTDVIVKVVRPNIERTIRTDVGLLYILAELAERYWPDGRRLRPREVVAEYEKTILDELDLMREAASASQLRRNFLGSELLYVPEVYWPYTVRNVMVMERINGTPISDIEGLERQHIDLRKLSERGVEIFFTQVFRDNFFHADMHPGNIFVSPEGQYIAVDFGIMGSLSPQDQRYLADNFLAFFKRDYRRVAELHVESGWVPAGTRINEFESAIRTVCEPIFERPLKDISFGQLLMRLFQTARRFNMEVQPQLVLLQKTLLNIEGLGRDLDPELDLWQTAKPFLERWMKEQVGAGALLRNLQANAPMWIERMPDIPELVYEALKLAQQERIHGVPKSDALNRSLRDIRRGVHRTYAAVTGGALIISAVLILAIPGERLSMLAGVPLWSWVFGLIGVAIIVYFWPRERAGA